MFSIVDNRVHVLTCVILLVELPIGTHNSVSVTAHLKKKKKDIMVFLSIILRHNSSFSLKTPLAFSLDTTDYNANLPRKQLIWQSFIIYMAHMHTY